MNDQTLYDDLAEQTKAVELEAYFERLAGIMPAILYVFDLETMSNVWSNQSLFHYLGYSDAEVQAMGADILPNLMHPSDFERYPEHFARLKALGDGHAEFEYRMQHKAGNWVWLHSHEAVHRRDDSGAPTQIVGSAHDITKTKEASARIELISSELRHRVSNIFAVSGAMVSIASRNYPEATEVLRDLRNRLLALGQAHEVALSPNEVGSKNAEDLIERTLRPYMGHFDIDIDVGDAVVLAKQEISPFGMILHELATNAVKYGGLKSAGGGISVTLQEDQGERVMNWAERADLSDLTDENAVDLDAGFGTKMIDLAAQQMGGSFERSLTPQGLTATFRFPRTDV